jgi:hypothetical protein
MFRILNGATQYAYDQFKQGLYAKAVDNLGLYDSLQMLTGVAVVEEAGNRLFIQADWEGGLYLSSDSAKLQGQPLSTNWFERFSASKVTKRQRFKSEEYPQHDFDLVGPEAPQYKLYSARDKYNAMTQSYKALTEPASQSKERPIAEDEGIKALWNCQPEDCFTSLDDILPPAALPNELSSEWKDLQPSSPMFEDIEDD